MTLQQEGTRLVLEETQPDGASTYECEVSREVFVSRSWNSPSYQSTLFTPKTTQLKQLPGER